MWIKIINDFLIDCKKSRGKYFLKKINFKKNSDIGLLIWLNRNKIKKNQA